MGHIFRLKTVIDDEIWIQLCHNLKRLEDIWVMHRPEYRWTIEVPEEMFLKALRGLADTWRQDIMLEEGVLQLETRPDWTPPDAVGIAFTRLHDDKVLRYGVVELRALVEGLKNLTFYRDLEREATETMRIFHPTFDF